MGIKWSDKVSNKQLYERVNIEKVGNRIMRLKFVYAGHLIRKKEFNWTRQILDWTPYGSVRRRGRPATRWTDDIINAVGTLWKSNVHRRLAWKKIGEAYAQRWAT